MAVLNRHGELVIAVTGVADLQGQGIAGEAELVLGEHDISGRDISLGYCGVVHLGLHSGDAADLCGDLLGVRIIRGIGACQGDDSDIVTQSLDLVIGQAGGHQELVAVQLKDVGLDLLQRNALRCAIDNRELGGVKLLHGVVGLLRTGDVARHRGVKAGGQRGGLADADADDLGSGAALQLGGKLELIAVGRDIEVLREGLVRLQAGKDRTLHIGCPQLSSSTGCIEIIFIAVGVSEIVLCVISSDSPGSIAPIGQGDCGGLLLAAAVLPGDRIIQGLADITDSQLAQSLGICSGSRGIDALHCGGGVHGHVIHLRTASQRTVQQLDAVEVGGVGDAVDLVLELLDLLLELGAVSAVLKGAVGGLLGQLVHAVEHVVDLGQGALGGLHQGDAVLGVVLGLVQAGDLGAHLLGDGEARGVVAGAVDLVAGGQLLQVLGQGGGVVGVVAVGVHRHDVMLDPHFDRFLSF